MTAVQVITQSPVRDRDATRCSQRTAAIRNSLRYASKKDWSKITKQMRAIYTAPTSYDPEIVRLLRWRQDVLTGRTPLPK